VSYNQLKIIIIKFKNQRKIKNIKKKNPILANGVVESPHGQVGGGRTTPMALRGGSATPKKQNGGGRNNPQ
jgi:hypothetical protein